MTASTARKQRDIDEANASGQPPVVFVHGLWLLASSWDSWRAFFAEHGFATLAPGWPDDPETVAAAREHPEAFAGQTIGAVTDHIANVIKQLDRKPVVIGHSFGGMIAQKLAGLGLAAVTVAIDPAPFRGVLPLPLSALKAASPALRNPRNRARAVTLTLPQFRFAFANAVSEQEARELYATFAVAAPGAPLFQAATANFNPRSEASVNTRQPQRGPLLIIAGEQDNTVPWAIANASYKQYAGNPAPTEITKIPGRGHSLTIDSGWREVAEVALRFSEQHQPSQASA
jgi:pimeloyl-ACP methyl ester carboxylesterase